MTELQKGEELEKEMYKEFLVRYQQAKNEHSEYQDIFNIIIVSELSQNIRLKPKCLIEETFYKLNRSLEFLGKVNLQGVKKLDIEINKFDLKIEVDLIKSFLFNLSNLKDIQNIYVNEFISKEKNPYTFILFMSYEPKVENQTYTFSNYSKGRNTQMTTFLSQKKVIKQTFAFSESLALESDSEAIKELSQFYKTLFEICTEMNATEQFILKENMNKKKSIDIQYKCQSSTLKQQSQSILDYLRLQNLDKRIKRFSLKLSSYTVDRIKENIDLSQFNELEIFKKFKLKIEILYQTDLTFIKEFLKSIKGFEIRNHYTSSSLNCEQFLQFNEQIGDQIPLEDNSVVSQYIPYDNPNLTTLRFTDFGSNELRLGQQFQLVDSFPNIKKVYLQNSQSINRLVVYNKYQKNILKCINNLNYFYFQRAFLFQNDILVVNLQRFNFHNIPFQLIQDIIFSIERPFKLHIESYNTVLQEEKSQEMYKFLYEIAFKTNIVCLRVVPSIFQQFTSLINMIKQIKSFATQEILFKHLISSYMTYNPDHIFQDLFDF